MPSPTAEAAPALISPPPAHPAMPPALARGARAVSNASRGGGLRHVVLTFNVCRQACTRSSVKCEAPTPPSLQRTQQLRSSMASHVTFAARRFSGARAKSRARPIASSCVAARVCNAPDFQPAARCWKIANATAAGSCLETLHTACEATAATSRGVSDSALMPAGSSKSLWQDRSSATIEALRRGPPAAPAPPAAASSSQVMAANS
mmetsp:Transcript_112261/g.194599  ORF Transcript_112261/g.194599 Transcript_112261/m.194599 type:complete len:206 (+) Transcript_112261:238-855(+)